MSAAPGSTRPYRGATANEGETGSEVACAATEFHAALLRAAELKRAGKKLRGELSLPVLGEMRKAK